MVRTRNSTFISIALSYQEKARLDAEVLRQGTNRNRFLRDFIASLPEPPEEK